MGNTQVEYRLKGLPLTKHSIDQQGKLNESFIDDILTVSFFHLIYFFYSKEKELFRNPFKEILIFKLKKFIRKEIDLRKSNCINNLDVIVRNVKKV